MSNKYLYNIYTVNYVGKVQTCFIANGHWINHYDSVKLWIGLRWGHHYKECFKSRATTLRVPVFKCITKCVISICRYSLTWVFWYQNHPKWWSMEEITQDFINVFKIHKTYWQHTLHYQTSYQQHQIKPTCRVS